MSRLIVKNLPKGITSDKLQEIFGQKGVITDVQLKYTKDGKFRHFGFVGYKNQEDAQKALEYFNNSFLNATHIHVEICKDLGDPNKPRAWSKYSSDSTAFKKLNKIDPEKEKEVQILKNKYEKKHKLCFNDELTQKYESDPLFAEFMDAHLKGKKPWNKSTYEELKKNKVLQDSDEVIQNKEMSSSASDDSESEGPKLAKADISDMEYLKTKMKVVEDEKLGNAETSNSTKQKNKKVKPFVELYTVILRGLKYTAKREHVKKFFEPLKPASIRLPPKIKGIAYVGFKTEMERKQALRKHKSFLDGKQVLVTLEIKNPDSNKHNINHKWTEQQESLKNEESVAESGCIFIRNLPYTISEDDIEALFRNYGTLSEVTMPIDRTTRKPKGFATITYLLPEDAVKAYTELDGSVFHGRILHLLPGKEKKSLEELMEKEGLTFREKKILKMKIQAASAHNWNTLFLGQNAVADIIAKTYNTTKEKVLDPTTSESLAVRLALGETQIVSETRKFLMENGVHLDAFNQAPKERSKNVILVKNLPVDTKIGEIHQLFSKFGELGRVLLPPSGVTAIVEFLEPFEAKSAFRRLAYSRFKNLPLYLEWAPINTFLTGLIKEKKEAIEASEACEEVEKHNSKEDHPELLDENHKNDSDSSDEDNEPEPNTTLFIKNLNFQTTEDSIREHFKKCGHVHYVTIAKKKDPKHPEKLLSLGYGFIQFKRKEEADKALKSYQNSLLDDHGLELKRSNRTLQTTVADARKKTQVRKQTGPKIHVKNIPFQASRKELYDLFVTFGSIKYLRLPQKMAGTGAHRGFAFVEYFSKHDAKRAFKELCQSTHLYGRRLVLEWAKSEENLDDMRRKTAEMFQHRTSHHTSRKGTTDLNMEEDE